MTGTKKKGANFGDWDIPKFQYVAGISMFLDWVKKVWVAVVVDDANN